MGSLLLCVALGLFAVLPGCGGGSGRGLEWVTDSVVRQGTEFQARMSYPVVRGTGAVADSINETIARTLNQNMLSVDLPWQTLTVAQAVDTLLSQKESDTVLRRMPYQLMSSGTVYERARVVSIRMQQYVYQGGAHGLSPVCYLNFDAHSGARLTPAQLCPDTLTLKALNREAFKNYLATKGEEDPTTYLFVTLDELPLPLNMGLDSTGLVMLYNQYEIAAYVFGVSQYTLPYTEIDSILSPLAQTR